MAPQILAIIAALVPVLIEYLDRRKEKKPYAERQAVLQEIAAGDMDSLARRVDRLREARRVRPVR